MDEVSALDLFRRPAMLRRQMLDEGVLLFRGLLGPGVVRVLGRLCMDVLQQNDIPVGERDDLSHFDWKRMPQDYEERRKKALPQLFSIEEVNALFHSEPLTDLAAVLIEEEFLPHPHKQVRFQPPGRPGYPPQTTGAHQDYVYNQGSPDMITVWVPLGQIDQRMGGLEVVPRSHLGGVYGFQEQPVAGAVTYTIANEPPASKWLSPTYGEGDCIVFHSLTLHRSSPNLSTGLRLSVDCRYQAISQPFAREILEPLPGVIDAYPRWSSDELKYYWRRPDLITVAWEPDRIPGYRG
jgi:hypothetical protein